MNNPLFQYLDFETISDCNRRCPTCLRNSHPDREALSPWFEKHLLPEELVYQAIEQALAIGFRGGVCLSHYNEPLMDERLPEIAHKVRSYRELATVHLNTNGDFITAELAAALDGALDHMIVSLYMDEPVKSQRAEWIATLFHKTPLSIIRQPDHIPTHFSPKFDVAALARAASGMSCPEADIRVIINHRRQYLLCCDDVIGNFDLGTFPEVGIEQFWWGKRQEIAASLSQAGGRSWNPYCLSCPRGAPWK